MRFTSALFLVFLHLPEWKGIGIGLDKSIHPIRRDRAPGVVDAFSAYDSGLPSNDPTKPETPSTLFTSPNIYIRLCPHPLYTRICSPLSLSSPLLSDLRPWHTPNCHTSVFRIRQRHRGRHSSITSFGHHGHADEGCASYSPRPSTASHIILLNLHVLYDRSISSWLKSGIYILHAISVMCDQKP